MPEDRVATVNMTEGKAFVFETVRTVSSATQEEVEAGTAEVEPYEEDTVAYWSVYDRPGGTAILKAGPAAPGGGVAEGYHGITTVTPATARVRAAFTAEATIGKTFPDSLRAPFDGVLLPGGRNEDAEPWCDGLIKYKPRLTQIPAAP